MDPSLVERSLTSPVLFTLQLYFSITYNTVLENYSDSILGTQAIHSGMLCSEYPVCRGWPRSRSLVHRRNLVKLLVPFIHYMYSLTQTQGFLNRMVLIVNGNRSSFHGKYLFCVFSFTSNISIKSILLIHQ